MMDERWAGEPFSASAKRLWVLGIVLLILAACSRSVALDERFTLREGETVRVRGAELTIEVEQIIDGLDGSQEIGDGSASLRVTVEKEGETEVYLETGERARIGGVEIGLERVVSDRDGLTCEMVVRR